MQPIDFTAQINMYDRVEKAFRDQAKADIPVDAALLLDWLQMAVRALRYINKSLSDQHIEYNMLSEAYDEALKAIQELRDTQILTCPDCGKAFPSCNSGHYCFGTMKDGSFFQFRQIPKNEG